MDIRWFKQFFSSDTMLDWNVWNLFLYWGRVIRRGLSEIWGQMYVHVKKVWNLKPFSFFVCSTFYFTKLIWLITQYSVRTWKSDLKLRSFRQIPVDLIWFDLIWFDLIWINQWIGLIWFGLVWSGLVLFELISFSCISFG